MTEAGRERGEPADPVPAAINRIYEAALSPIDEEALGRHCLAVAEEATGAGYGILVASVEPDGEATAPVTGGRGWPADLHDGLPGAAALQALIREGGALPAAGERFLAMPIAADGQVIALLGLGAASGGFAAEAHRIAGALAPAIGRALHGKRAETALRAQAARQHALLASMRDLQGHQRRLLAELQHRVRNILTVVRSVFGRTVEAGGELEEVATHFRGRLDSLARTQLGLTQSLDGRIDLEMLVREELLSVGAGDGPELAIDGPDVALPPKTAESIGLAVHELTTNALKYGALKVAGARLDISWTTTDPGYGQTQQLTLTWSERGVPAVAVQPRRHGFGSELITEALPYGLGAETRLEFRGGGVHCVICVPLTPAGKEPLP